MQRPTRFRQSGRIAGTFVLTGLALLVGGWWLAARSQGWFEGKFRVHSRFTTREGSFGLREGCEVMIMNTMAGRVGRIMPTPDGQIDATFIIQDRYRPCVHTNSLARVKRKFVAAGDAYVEISEGYGGLVENNGRIRCVKDEDIVDTAQRMLTDFQDTILPLMEDLREMLDHGNNIVAQLDEGQGLVGSALKDIDLETDVKSLINEVRALVDETHQTVIQTHRVIRGAQRHWLLKKYVERDDPEEFFVPSFASPGEAAERLDFYRRELRRAQAGDDVPAIVRNTFVLADCMLCAGAPSSDILSLAADAEADAAGDASLLFPVHLLRVKVAMRDGTADAAISAVRTALASGVDGIPDDLILEGHLLAAEAFIAAGEIKAASAHVRKAERTARKHGSSVAGALLAGGQGMLARAEERFSDAAEAYDRQAALLGRQGLFHGMSVALETAGLSMQNAGQHGEAAERFFRAGRSQLTCERRHDAVRLLRMAAASADKVGDTEMEARARSLIAAAEAPAGVGGEGEGDYLNYVD